MAMAERNALLHKSLHDLVFSNYTDTRTNKQRLQTRLYSANCVWLQIAEQARIIVAQEQKYTKDVTRLNAQVMHYSARVGIQSFSPVDLGDDGDEE